MKNQSYNEVEEGEKDYRGKEDPIELSGAL